MGGEAPQELEATPEDNGRGARMRRTFHLLRQGVFVTVLLAVVVVLWLYWDRAEHAPAPTEASVPQQAIPVGVVTVEPRSVPLTSRFLAQTLASQTVPIRARVSGYLIERAFDEGQHVEAGQVLFRIEPQPFEVALRQAEAQLTAAEARLQRAERQMARFQALAEQQSAAASELEQWQEEQQVAVADVALQRARVEQAQLDLGYTTITTPIDGVVGRAEQDVGSYISPQTNPLLATVRTVDPLYVRFSVSEQEMLRWQRLIGAGVVADVPVDEFVVAVVLADGREHPHAGRIDFVDVAVDPSTGTAIVRATVPNPESRLLPGQYVHAVVTGAERFETILVPQSAVLQMPVGTAVYVVDDRDTAQVRPVRPGDWYGDSWIIESGLEAGDRVIVDRLMQVRPGAPVVPTPAVTSKPEEPTAPK